MVRAFLPFLLSQGHATVILTCFNGGAELRNTLDILHALGELAKVLGRLVDAIGAHHQLTCLLVLYLRLLQRLFRLGRL